MFADHSTAIRPTGRAEGPENTKRSLANTSQHAPNPNLPDLDPYIAVVSCWVKNEQDSGEDLYCVVIGQGIYSWRGYSGISYSEEPFRARSTMFCSSISYVTMEFRSRTRDAV